MTDLTGARRATAEGVIASVAGPEATLRDDQATAVGALCDAGARVLVVQATGRRPRCAAPKAPGRRW